MLLARGAGWSRGFSTPCPDSLVSEDLTLFSIILPNPTEINLPQALHGLPHTAL